MSDGFGLRVDEYAKYGQNGMAIGKRRISICAVSKSTEVTWIV
jgi:hypothetical protein